MFKNNNITENQINSLLLAAAVVELFPKALLVEGQGTGACFFCDIVFPFDFEPHLLGVIEDRMRMIHKEDRVLKSLEMTPSNAALWMQHQKQYLIAEKLKKTSSSLVTMGQIGEFATWVSHLHLPKNRTAFTAKLKESFIVCSSIPGLVRIVGVANSSYKQKRLFWQEHNHLQLICDMQLFMPLENQKGWVWLPKAEAMKELLINYWKKESFKENVEFITSPYLPATINSLNPVSAYHKQVFQNSQKKMNKLAELTWVLNPDSSDMQQGLFQPFCYLTDSTHLFCLKENLLKQCISSLQFILKIPKILGFEFEIILRSSHSKIREKSDMRLSIMQMALKELQLDYRIEKKGHSDFIERIEIHIADSLKRMWCGPFLSILKSDQEAILLRSMFGNLERMLGLLVEQTGGKLPFWLTNENIRIIVVNSESRVYAEAVCSQLSQKGIKVLMNYQYSVSLAQRFYEAIKARISYIVLIGEKERLTNTLTLHESGLNQEQGITLDALFTRIQMATGGKNSESENQ
ncbi:His/Gly/Thr/Pro-type tRNA ligase C-terminal domain-containing protein [Candidatus Rhabdochlamydia sp. T3358]|uniref:His/Gly/Thr/Pro-type tRNA ligase C-terminal domain-containing protein n=1 Tax=Candidatus Rhabdochlamydia sp. T3358 TaxID=2099795 RepID=UPI0010B493C7|nr:His/Gly/Thr/Pro-type tRNA ligase C-terminal domain-containing protein [Candidatus Rhabdochlamydia sp. T3358]VHO02762.1 Threonine--tRNA ligase [Candidatus Rhabdochlamydia sp. T3358]